MVPLFLQLCVYACVCVFVWCSLQANMAVGKEKKYVCFPCCCFRAVWHPTQTQTHTHKKTHTTKHPHKHTHPQYLPPREGKQKFGCQSKSTGSLKLLHRDRTTTHAYTENTHTHRNLQAVCSLRQPG